MEGHSDSVHDYGPIEINKKKDDCNIQSYKSIEQSILYQKIPKIKSIIGLPSSPNRSRLLMSRSIFLYEYFVATLSTDNNSKTRRRPNQTKSNQI